MAEPPTTPVDAALDLLSRLPPDNVVENLGSLLELAPDLTEELLSRVDQPLQARPGGDTAAGTLHLTRRARPQVAMDDVADKEFLLCDYNRDADSYRCASGSFCVLRCTLAHASDASGLCSRRSPWSNQYFPPLDDGATPSAELRVRLAALPSA
jgi:capping protein beta